MVSIMVLLFSADQKAHSTNLIGGWVGARFEVLSAVLLRIQVFRDVTLCHWVSGSQRLKYCVALIRKADQFMKNTQRWLFFID
jgi:hypothetical protein